MPEGTAQGFEMTLADGSVVKAENVEEAVKIVAKMKTDTSAALKEERTKREELETRLNALQTEVSRATPPRREEGSFDKDHYYRLVGEDPVMAQNYIDAHRFGIQDPSQVPQYFQGLQNTVNTLEQQTLAASFINSHADFPANNESAETLTKEVLRLRSIGHPVNMDTLDIAYRNCVSAELIKPIEQRQDDEEVNPSLGGGGGAAMDAEASRVEQDVMSGKMSMADFEKYLRSKNMIP